MSATDQHHLSNRAFYDRISKAYDFIADSNEEAARQTGERALDLQAGETVLEIGFGTGNSLIDLAKAVGPTGRACGIDISSGMRDVTAGKIAEQGLRNITLALGDARQLPYADGEFDAAFASMTLELFPLEDIPAVLQETKRVLKSGGRLGVVSMAKVRPGQKASGLEKTYIWMHRHFPHLVDCQPIDSTAFMKAAGFTIAQEIDLGIWTMPVRAVIGTKST
jgi:demethylmenaquinone methyltransferase/2-methoxy-6-polyprenyl-1,4-benzoquinol methylase